MTVERGGGIEPTFPAKSLWLAAENIDSLLQAQRW